MPRGDGRLSLDLLPDEKGPRDACGVFGVWSGGGAEGEEVAKLTYFGLYALQHRGQESAGIAVSNGSQILVYKDMGLVAQVFDEGHLNALRGHLAIGHTRYSTTGASVWENAQPTFRSTANGSIALGHNGNLTNTRDLLTLVEKREAESGMLPYDEGQAPASARRDRRHDRHRGHLRAARRPIPTGRWSHAALEVLPQLRGAFSLVFMDEGTLYAARDAQGVRPLVLGRLERGWVVASETAALDIVGASVVREIEPGELIAIDEHGLRTPAVRRRRNPRAACSSTSTWPGPTPRSPAARCTRRASRWAAGSRSRPRSRPTWSSRCPSRARRPRSATRRAAASPTASAW